MKKIVEMLAVITVGLVLLTGCSTATPEQQYVSTVRSNVLGLEDTADRDIVSLGQAACHALDVGVSREALMGVTEGNGYTSRESAVFVDGAIKYLCPPPTI